ATALNGGRLPRVRSLPSPGCARGLATLGSGAEPLRGTGNGQRPTSLSRARFISWQPRQRTTGNGPLTTREDRMTPRDGPETRIEHVTEPRCKRDGGTTAKGAPLVFGSFSPFRFWFPPEAVAPGPWSLAPAAQRCLGMEPRKAPTDTDRNAG